MSGMAWYGGYGVERQRWRCGEWGGFQDAGRGCSVECSSQGRHSSQGQVYLRVGTCGSLLSTQEHTGQLHDVMTSDARNLEHYVPTAGAQGSRLRWLISIHQQG